MIGRKGTYGYIKRGRILFGAVTFCLLAAVLAMYFGAQWYFKTNKNVFTILAALSCIGVGKFAVDFIMFCRAGGCSESAREAIELHKGKLPGAYDLFILPNGGAEQDADQWWDAMCQSTKRLLGRVDVRPDEIGGISFCSQMQGLVLVDQEGRALRRPMSYMDQRAGEVFRETQTHGLTVSGVALPMLLKSLIRTRAASTSVKDPLWKYKWVQKNEPEVFSETYKWLDVKEYLICRCTGEFVMTRDSAYSTFLYDTRKGHEGWSHALCSMYGVEEKHLPALIECTDVAGTLTERAALELGLAAGTPVYGGGGDATLIGVGAGATRTGAR